LPWNQSPSSLRAERSNPAIVTLLNVARRTPRFATAVVSPALATIAPKDATVTIAAPGGEQSCRCHADRPKTTFHVDVCGRPSRCGTVLRSLIAKAAYGALRGAEERHSAADRA
jgi:hypothetical protein